MSAEDSEPANDLEVALISAARDEAARPHFYETLLKSHVLIVPHGDAPQVVDGRVPEATKIALAAIDIQGKPHTPFFSSEKRLPSGTSFLRLAATDFFPMTKGSHLVLNPGSAYGKVFLPDEVASLLDGSLLRPGGVFTAKTGTEQMIGQPRDYPHAFAAAVSRYLASEPDVERAYLAQHFIAGVHASPAVLVALVAPEAGFDRVAGALGLIATEIRTPQGAVDVIRLRNDDLGYFANQAPIYDRKRKSLLGRLFG